MANAPTWVLMLVALLGVGFVLMLPLQLFVAIDLFLGAVVAEGWAAGGILFDYTDILLGALFLGLLLRGGPGAGSLRSIPYGRLWLLLAIFLTISFFSTPSWIRGEPVPRDYSDPMGFFYQLYRYHWKTILYFPICALLLGGHKRLPLAIGTLLVAGDTLSAVTISENLLGFKATWLPFTAGNAVGGVLLVPLLAAVAGLIYYRSRFELIFCGVSFVMIARALSYTGSRGAVGSAIFGIVLLSFLAFFRSEGRRRGLRLIPAGLALVALAFIIRPDLLDRPYMERALTLTQPMQQRTMVWRLETRWPHFLDKVMEHPWVGTGSDVDRSLSTGEGVGNTPHNSYLSLALIYGLPVALCWLALAALGIMGALRTYFRSQSWDQRKYSLLVITGLAVLLLHATVDRSLLLPFIQKEFWLLAAAGCSLGRVPLKVEETETSRRALRPVAQPEPAPSR